MKSESVLFCLRACYRYGTFPFVCVHENMKHHRLDFVQAFQGLIVLIYTLSLQVQLLHLLFVVLEDAFFCIQCIHFISLSIPWELNL